LLVGAGLFLSIGCGDDDGKNTTEGLPSTSDGGPSEAGPTHVDASGPDVAVRSDAGPAVIPGQDATLPPGCPLLVNDRDCDKTKRPIVFVHGTTANGESFSHPAMLLASNGYCPDRIRAVEYHSLIGAMVATADAGAADAGARDGGQLQGLDGGLGGIDGGSADSSVSDAAAAPNADSEARYRGAKLDIDRVIEELRRETGADKVDLAGHSQGSGHGARYTRENPDKVAHYIHLAGGQLEANPGGVPTLCLSSTGDRPVTCKTTKNVTFQEVTLDHAAVSSSTEAAVEIYKFLNEDREPKYKEVQCGEPIVLEGRAPTFGDNTFLVGSKIEVYELGAEPRLRGTPAKTFEIGADGNFGPWEAKRGVAYEFKMIAPPGNARRPRRTYMRPFTRSDRLLRFNFESLDPVASGTGSKVNYGPDHSVLVVRRRQKAFLFGRDVLKIDGFDAINAQNARQRSVICALYLYDSGPMSMGPGDKVSNGGSVIRATFLESSDIYMQAATPAFINVMFNGETLRVPNWPSATEGMSLVLVD
jgi:pimeloyl-ACP methyl ester carboxylesterase